jgi:hypothetical protein
MPMPPPKPTTESARDRQVGHEIRQLVRALREQGPQTAEELGRLVGAPYWERGRFERAVGLAIADGLVVRDADGLLQVV